MNCGSRVAGSRLVCVVKPTLGSTTVRLLQIAAREVDSGFKLIGIIDGIIDSTLLVTVACAGQV